MKTGHIKEAKEALEAAKVADPGLEETTVLLNNIKDEFTPEPKKYSKKKGRKSKKGKSGKKGKKAKTAKTGKAAKKSPAGTEQKKPQ